MKIETQSQRAKEEFNTQLERAIKAYGGINITSDKDEPISMIMLTELKGVYAVDKDDLSIIQIESLFQEVATGQVMAFNKEFVDLFKFNFAFTGSKEECYKYLYEHKEALINEISMFKVKAK